jgi:hypothetical protein
MEQYGLPNITPHDVRCMLEEWPASQQQQQHL